MCHLHWHCSLFTFFIVSFFPFLPFQLFLTQERYYTILMLNLLK